MGKTRIQVGVIFILLLAGGVSAAEFDAQQITDLGTLRLFTPEETRQVLTAEFTFRNPTGETLEYVRTERASCACTQVQPEQLRLPPGESMTIRMSVDLGKKHFMNEYDLRESGIVLFNRSRGDGEFRLGLQTQAKLLYQGVPTKLHLQPLQQGSYRVERFFQIVVPDGVDFTLRQIRCEDDRIDLKVQKSWFGREYKITFGFDMGKMRLGDNRISFVADYVLNGQSRRQEISLTFQQIPHLLRPDKISLGLLRGGEVKMKSFHMLPGYEGASYVVKRIEVRPADLQCQWQQSSDQQISGMLTFQSPRVDSAQNRQWELRVIPADERNETIVIPVFAMIQPADEAPPSDD